VLQSWLASTVCSTENVLPLLKKIDGFLITAKVEAPAVFFSTAQSTVGWYERDAFAYHRQSLCAMACCRTQRTSVRSTWRNWQLRLRDCLAAAVAAV